MIKNVMGVILLLAGVGASVGCGAADMEGEAFGEGDEDIASSEAALGEAACGTMLCTPQNFCVAHNVNQCGPVTLATSPFPPYGSASCSKQFVAEDTTPPTVGQRILPIVHWKGAALGPANCASAKVELGLYQKLGAGSATLVGTETYTGTWNGSTCAFKSPTAKPFVVPSANLKAVRVTGSASLGAIQQRVEVGFWHIC
jgi:hypothetical protein